MVVVHSGSVEHRHGAFTVSRSFEMLCSWSTEIVKAAVVYSRSVEAVVVMHSGSFDVV